MELSQKKDLFKLNQGLNTEINELNFPDGFTVDEANYELLVDGSRRRRKGLANESGVGAAKSVDTFVAGDFVQSYLWTDVGGDPDLNLVCYRQGNNIYFAVADETISGGWYTGDGSSIDLGNYVTTGATTANTEEIAVSFSHGRGTLFVSGPYIKTIFVTFDSATSRFASEEVGIRIRDYGDQEDGTNLSTEPTSLTDPHNYNLRNRGWTNTDRDQFHTDLSKYPARNSLWWKGFKRTYGTSVAEADGQKSWDSTKLDNEAFGGSSAPRGSMFLNVYDTSFGVETSGVVAVDISTWTYIDNGGNWTVTLTTSGVHGYGVGDEFTISGHQMYGYSDILLGTEQYDWLKTFDGTWTAVTGTTGSTLIFTYTPMTYDVDGWFDQFLSLGQVGAARVRPSGTVHTDAPRANCFFAGRLFTAGMYNTEFADSVFFSQIADGPEKYGRCYQDADPTDENFNALTSADGGHIIIPGMSGVQEMIQVRNSLLVFANEGVWEVSGGSRGVFTADGYSVRKITSAGCSSPTGVLGIEDSAVYTGPSGIYVVSPNQYTGQLEAQSSTEQTIQTLWNQIPDVEQQKVQAAYDSSLRRAYFMYGNNGTQIGIDTMLIFDARAGAWFKYTFDTPTNNVLLTGFAIPNADDTSENKKMKFIYEASTTTVQVADFAQTTFDDWDGTNGPLPYMVLGHDNIGDWQRRRQAPMITVFSKKTETGYTAAGNGWDPVNESSTLMTAYWDFTDDAVTNKIGSQNEVYRHVRQFVPSGTGDTDGYPLVITRNKVRGRGRSLQLRFDGATDKDSHILGFTTNYKVTRKV